MKPHNSALRRGASITVILTVTLVIFSLFSLTVTADTNKQTKKVEVEESHQLKSVSKQQLDSHQKDHYNNAQQHHQQQQQQQQQQQSAVAQISSEQAASSSSQAQPVAEKKQGDAAASASAPSSSSSSSSAAQDLFGGEEYVQIKPEEITINENGKEEYTSSGQQAGSQAVDLLGNVQQQQAAEHKSIADDELNAHLASDSINQQESAYQPSYAAPMLAQRVRPSGPKSYNNAPRQAGTPYKQAPMPYPSAGHPQAPAAPAYQAGPRPQPRLPPSYITLKGKLTGINSIISQYPHPAPGYPHQGPRHLPRGAAAGYAAFRDFVKAHASKYKSPLASVAPSQPVMPAQISYSNPAPSQYESNKDQGYKQSVESAPVVAPQAYQEPKQQASSYKAPSNGAPAKTKVTIAQAYIPHPIKPAAQASSDLAYNSQSSSSSSSSQYLNPILAKLYGGHAPQGNGKTEYNKDYGMVIHYPQATVYTEPMTVDQLHKLTGAGISQVLEQLQYNLANGHRDESNTIRANNKHHIGHGITIHAKEYYAPGKSGQYVPTTAAVISTNGKYNSEPEQTSYEQASSGPDSAAPLTSYAASMLGQKAADLGPGYERVKQAVASSQEKYNNKYSNNQQGSNSDYYQPQQAQPALQHAEPPNAVSSGELPKMPVVKLTGNGEPLSAITNLLGSELESLYKANAALTKHIEPEIHQAITKATSGYGKSQALKYSELGQASPFTPYNNPFMPTSNQQRPRYPPSMPQPHPPQGRYPRYGSGGQRGPRKGPQGGNRYPPHRGMGGPRFRGPSGYRPPQYGPPRPQHPPHPHARPHPHPHPQPPQQHRQNQYNKPSQAQYAAEQALNQQMMQFLQDFQASDEQYGKNLPNTVNQGYPHKIMQKYQQNQKYGGQQQGNSPYHQQEGLEIPQGPNDQIGEIADLIESLKGALDLNKPDGGDSYGLSNQKQLQQPEKNEAVRYLSSALGQAPSYALQVPVSGGESGYDASKKGAGAEQTAYQRPQQAANQQPQQAYAPAPSAEIQSNYLANQQQQQQHFEQAALAAYQQAPGGETYGQRTPAAAGYGQQQQQQPSASGYSSAQQVAQYGQQAQVGGEYQQQNLQQGQVQPDLYQQHQQQQQGSEYSAPSVPAAPQVVNAAISAYGASSSGSAGAGSYPQQAISEHQAPLNQYASAAPATATVSEHTSVINHLVPVQTQQASYESSAAQTLAPQQQQQQPAHQIAIGAPTESQYQQAQSLSSFVDGLPSDYQELLRQPALLDNPSVSHLAIPEVSSYSSNATASNAPSSQNYDQQHSVGSSGKTNGQQHQQQSAQSTYQQQPNGQHQSTGGSTRQYSTVKK